MTNLQYLFCVIICSITAVKINKFWRIFQFAVFVFVGNMKFNHSYNPLLSNTYLIEFVAISSNLLRAEHGDKRSMTEVKYENNSNRKS